MHYVNKLSSLYIQVPRRLAISPIKPEKKKLRRNRKERVVASSQWICDSAATLNHRGMFHDPYNYLNVRHIVFNFY